MVAFLEMVGALALPGLLLCRAVLALRAWIRTRMAYRSIPRRLYRRSLQHALSSRRLMFGLGLWLLAMVAALLVKTGILIPGLLCLLLVMDLLWSAIPPVVLVSSASETQAGSSILREVAAAARPMKTVHFLRGSTAGTDCLRTVDRQCWEEAYGSFADFVPLIVIDCSMVTDHLLNEASYVLNPLRRWKVLFVCGASGECPLLGCIGLDHWPDPTVTVIQQMALQAVVRDRLRVGRLAARSNVGSAVDSIATAAIQGGSQIPAFAVEVETLSDTSAGPFIENRFASLKSSTWNNTEGSLMRISVPPIGRPYDVPQKGLSPYTPSEQSTALPKLKGRSLFIDFQKGIDGPQTATRLIRETLGGLGVSWVNRTEKAEAVVWIQGGSGPMRFAFVVADLKDPTKFIAAECGPRELTATVMTGVSEFFAPATRPASTVEAARLIGRVNDINRAITGASIAQDWVKARQLMNELTSVVQEMSSISGPQAVKPIIDALADAAGGYANTGFPEAKALREASIDTLARIGKESIPWINKGLTHSHPAVREACRRALRACGEIPWWQFW